MKKTLNEAGRKDFDLGEHQASISKLRKNMPGLVIEEASRKVAIDILQKYEGFEGIERGPNFRGTPFDFFGYKDSSAYIIEMKSSLEYFQLPGETQKRRISELLEELPDLKVAILQLALNKKQYRILYHEQVERLLLHDRQPPITPIVEWLKERLQHQDTG